MAKIGVEVIETQASAAPDIVPSALTNTGFLFKSYRGPVNYAVAIGSEFQFINSFGKHVPTAYLGSYVVKAAFKNAEPFSFQGYGVRILGSGYVAANAVVVCGSTIFEAKVVGAQTSGIEVEITAGTAVTQRTVVVTKDAITETFTDVDLDTFEAAFNRGATGINSALPSELVRVKNMPNVLPAVAVAAPLTGGTTTVKGTLKCVGTDATNCTVYAGQFGRQDPGLWGNSLRVDILAHPDANSRTFETYEREYGVYNLKETKSGIDKDSIDDSINGTGAGSSFIYLSGLTHTPDPGQSLTLTGGLDGAAVTNDDYVGSQPAETGLYAFDQKDLQLIAGCESANCAAEFLFSLESYCSAKRTMLAIGSTPYGASLDTLESASAGIDSYTEKLFKQKSHLACYRSWIKMSNGTGGYVWVPNVGHVIGAGYVRKMDTRGGLPHIAPAGTQTFLRECVDIEYPMYNDSDLERLVHSIGINPVMYLPKSGFIVRTSRTFSSLNKNYSAHIRRTINYLVSTFRNSFAWVEQEPNNADTRKRVTESFTFFLGDLYDKGVFETAGGFANNVAIMCNSQNNTPADIANRKLNAEITVNIIECVESVTIKLSHVNKSFSVTES